MDATAQIHHSRTLAEFTFWPDENPNPAWTLHNLPDAMANEQSPVGRTNRPFS